MRSPLLHYLLPCSFSVECFHDHVPDVVGWRVCPYWCQLHLPRDRLDQIAPERVVQIDPTSNTPFGQQTSMLGAVALRDRALLTRGVDDLPVEKRKGAPPPHHPVPAGVPATLGPIQILWGHLAVGALRVVIGEGV